MLMPISTLSRNLRHLLSPEGLTLSQLARETGIPQPTLHHLCTGNTKNPRDVLLDKLASFFKISVAQLQGKEPLTHNLPQSVKVRFNLFTAPLIDWNAALTWTIQKSNDIFKEIILHVPVSKNAFALRMGDTPIQGHYPKNTLLIFDPDYIPHNHNKVLAISIENNEAYLSALSLEADDLLVKSLRPKKSIPENYRILATLIEARIQELDF